MGERGVEGVKKKTEGEGEWEKKMGEGERGVEGRNKKREGGGESGGRRRRGDGKGEWGRIREEDEGGSGRRGEEEQRRMGRKQRRGREEERDNLLQLSAAVIDKGVDRQKKKIRIHDRLAYSWAWPTGLRF